MIRFLNFADPKSISEENPEGIKQDYPIRISYYALKMLKEELGRGLLINDDGTDYAAYETLLFWGLRRGHQKLTPKEPFPFVRDEIVEIMDEVYFDFMKLVPDFFADETLKETEGKGETEGKKRKV